MAWITIDDQIARHPKLIRAGMSASWLWVCGLAYCNSQLTNGFIPAGTLHMLAPCSVAKAKHLAERLCLANLWERVEGGYQVHDYLKYQPDRETVLERMQRRKARASAAAHARWMRPRIEHASEPNPTQPKESANALSPTKDGNEGPKTKSHRGHFYCGHRFCVPHFLNDEFNGMVPSGLDGQEMNTWYKQLDAWAARQGITIEDPIKFVRDSFRKRLENKRRHGYVAAHERVENVLDTCPHDPHCTSSRACQTLRDLEHMKEAMRHEGDDPSAGRQIESAPIETGRSYAVRHRDA